MGKNKNRKRTNKNNIVKSSGSAGASHGEKKIQPGTVQSRQQQPYSSADGKKSSKLSALQQSFARKLEGARFRRINEDLYSTRGEASFAAFQAEPKLFEAYHIGFREQCAQWPSNPLDGIIEWVRSTLPATAIVADMGCGDARLAASVPQQVHSFDLVSQSPVVTACDVANVPLEGNCVDVVVFCLALMGTNISDFIREAHRILRVGGLLRIAEVRSRFEGEADGIQNFMRFLQKAGFDRVSLNSSISSSNDDGKKMKNKKMKTEKSINAVADNKMFFEVQCVKTTRESSFDASFTVKACVYKKR